MANGILVSPEMWQQMQSILAMFPVPLAPASVSPVPLAPASVPPVPSAPASVPPAPPNPISAPTDLVSEQAGSIMDNNQSLPNLVTSLSQSKALSNECSPKALNNCLPENPSKHSKTSTEDSSEKAPIDDLQADQNKPDSSVPTQSTPSGELDSSSTPTLIRDPKSYNYVQGEPLDPPPSACFLSMDDLVFFCQEWAKTHGYAVAKINSVPNKNIYIGCDQSGKYCGLTSNPSGQKTSTVKIDCPFQLRGTVPTSKIFFDKTWTLDTRCAAHNHEPLPGPFSHVAYKQLLPEEIDDIRRLSKAKLKPAQILLQLRTSNNQTLATNKTISNALQKIRREDLDGKSPMAKMLSILKEMNWAWEFKVDASGAVQKIFFAHPGSIHLAQINHHIALLDATYKTNCYDIPLLHIIGQAATNQSFSIAFCFLTHEDNKGYLWAVEVLKKLVWHPEQTPKVANLCTWHINKNITTNCKKYFPAADKKDKKDKKEKKEKKEHPWEKFMNLWNQVTYSKMAEIYVEQYNQLKIFLATCPAALKYLDKWIIPQKERFVVAWACQYPHLRNLNTSWVESGHAYLKTFVTNSTGDLLSVFQSLSLAVDAQIKKVHETVGTDTIKTLINVPKAFIPILGKISTFVIKQAIEQFDCLKNLDPNVPCSQTLTKGIGIPCAHKISEILEDGRALMPSDFHSQWNLQYNPESNKKDEIKLNLDDEIKKLTLALSEEPPRRLENIFVQIHQLVAGTHSVVPIQAPGKQQLQKKRAAKASTLPERRSKRIKHDNFSEESDSDSPEESDSDSPEESDSDSPEEDIEDSNSDDYKAKDNGTSGASESDNQFETVEKQEADPISPSKSDQCESNQATYLEQIPVHLRTYIKDVFDPNGDGNCGFHCMSKALGYERMEGWRRVRQEMIDKIANNKSIYSKLQGGDIKINRISDALNVTCKTELIPPAKWLNKLEHGQILANTYNLASSLYD
ncbi:hypothetical protein PTTG_26591 [Puccinia triticina 1-1 BBBD Race 1]|uniref:OTU domain-containing protein n=1 Tax=Puccinia triticina (isolate 1-1 / race 1 (BBBD)) TaxID=630390 RepID=A0A180GSQ2_PUCT1|nr:hypothetical protein PTTG_26591 [Puccinia triticina 1-1 BBBD Race 1]